MRVTGYSWVNMVVWGGVFVMIYWVLYYDINIVFIGYLIVVIVVVIILFMLFFGVMSGSNSRDVFNRYGDKVD